MLADAPWVDIAAGRQRDFRGRSDPCLLCRQGRAPKVWGKSGGKLAPVSHHWDSFANIERHVHGWYENPILAPFCATCPQMDLRNLATKYSVIATWNQVSRKQATDAMSLEPMSSPHTDPDLALARRTTFRASGDTSHPLDRPKARYWPVFRVNGNAVAKAGQSNICPRLLMSACLS